MSSGCKIAPSPPTTHTPDSHITSPACALPSSYSFFPQSISKKYLKNPLSIDASNDGGSRTATTVSHRALLVPPDTSLRSSLLEDVVTVELSRPLSKAIVFTQVPCPPTGPTEHAP